MSKEQKLTPWFPAQILPARAGVYERQWDEGIPLYARWDGREWMHSFTTVAAASMCTYPTNVIHIGWRGLAEEPK